MVINESSESLHARIGKAQHEDSDIEKLFVMTSVRRLCRERRIII